MSMSSTTIEPEQLHAAARARTPTPVAWVVMRDAELARTIAHALRGEGFDVDIAASGIAPACGLVQTAARLPDVVVTGLRFDDGDGLQLIRTLSRRQHPPAVFIASHQQRAVIKAAVALAEVCNVPLAGVAEQPMEAAAIARALRTFERRPARLVPPSPPPALSRNDLLSFFDRGAVHPWMQPKMRLETSEIVGFEALMRAHDENGHLVMPDRLVGALAANGLLDVATMHMARHAVHFVATCLSEGMAISASINVSMQSLANLAFCHELAAAVEEVHLDPSWITLEITETDAMSDLQQVIENTARIRMLGFNLAIDDFGTAYSSLFQLSRIPFSELKIERAFVACSDTDASKRAIVRACAQLGQSLGLHVVAEGVETQAELDLVRDCGCTQVQGYLVSKPMPASRAMSWLRALPDLRFAG
jgi:EAL domain-containing protein (putative c-di-GMP-specific phosphodiesterase class I)/ActR/RegA family two-component response regulator